MSLEKTELLEKLDTISSRYKDVIAIRRKADNVVPEDNYLREVVVPKLPDGAGGEYILNNVDHASENAGDLYFAAYENVHPLPREPKMQPVAPLETFKKPAYISYLIGASVLLFGVCIFFLLGGIFGTRSLNPALAYTIPIIFAIAGISAFASFLSLLGIPLSLGFAILKMQLKNEKIRKTQMVAQDKYNKELNQYNITLKEYREKEQEAVNIYWEWRAVYLEHLAEEERIKAQLELDRQAIIEEIRRSEYSPAVARFNEANQDLVSDNHLPKLDTIIALVKEGRATSVQEAINIINADEAAMQQILQATLKGFEQAIESFSEETDRIIADNERRIQERREILMEMAEERREEERRRRWEEEDRREKEEKAERIRQDQERRERARRQHDEAIAMYKERNATDRQCRGCANMSRCRMAFQRSNCASFVPK